MPSSAAEIPAPASPSESAAVTTAAPLPTLAPSAPNREAAILVAAASNNDTVVDAPTPTVTSRTAAIPENPTPITSSVGKGARNKPDDVRAVQRRLIVLGYPIEVDGRSSPALHKGIQEVLTPFIREQANMVSISREAVPAMLVPTGPLASYFFGVGNARLSESRATTRLSEPVGTGQANQEEDVRKVQSRLAELGFPVSVDGFFGQETSHFLRLFGSLVVGTDQHSHVADLVGTKGPKSCCACGPCSATTVADSVGPGSILAERLFSDDAPGWTRFPEGGAGWVNTDRDGYDYGAKRSLEVLNRAGERFEAYMRKNPSAPAIALNDVSKKNGTVAVTARGRAEHGSHRNGIDLDIRLPKHPGNGEPWGTRTDSRAYDRETMYAMIEAFATDEMVERVLIQDPDLLARAARDKKPWASKLQLDPGHIDHAHVDVKHATER